MTSFLHRKFIERILKLDELPNDPAAYQEWIRAANHIEFLRQSSLGDEIIIFARGPYTFVHSVVVPNSALSPIDEDDLLEWSDNPSKSLAGYAYGGSRENMWIERGYSNRGSQSLDNAIDLLFERTFEGWSGEGATYFELNQEYAHATDIHWRPDQRSYCRFDQNGDIEEAVSITTNTNLDDASLVTFRWNDLETFLSIGEYCLVQMFYFTLCNRKSFTSWSKKPESIIKLSTDIFYRQKIDSSAAYTRGIHIVRPRIPREEIEQHVKDGWRGGRNQEHEEFIAHDWRNDAIRKISTDPSMTTNYFNTENNNLPFELSPVFFAQKFFPNTRQIETSIESKKDLYIVALLGFSKVTM